MGTVGLRCANPEQDFKNGDWLRRRLSFLANLPCLPVPVPLVQHAVRPDPQPPFVPPRPRFTHNLQLPTVDSRLTPDNPHSFYARLCPPSNLGTRHNPAFQTLRNRPTGAQPLIRLRFENNLKFPGRSRTGKPVGPHNSPSAGPIKRSTTEPAASAVPPSTMGACRERNGVRHRCRVTTEIWLSGCPSRPSGPGTKTCATPPSQSVAHNRRANSEFIRKGRSAIAQHCPKVPGYYRMSRFRISFGRQAGTPDSGNSGYGVSCSPSNSRSCDTGSSCRFVR